MATNSKQTSAIAPLHVAIHTGSHLLAGIDSRVWMQLVGDKQRTQWMRVVPTDGSFSRNASAGTDLFFASELHPGTITEVKLQHDASGSFKGWYLDGVRVAEQAFDFHCWLARDEPPYRTDASSVPEEARRRYTVATHTTETFLGGTDANVSVQLIGTRATTAWIRLWEPGVDNFAPGRTDEFRIFAEDVGELVAVWIKHDNSGVGPGWHLSWLAIDGQRHEVHRWLATDEGAGQIDYLWLLRPMVVQKNPLSFRLVTFADIHQRARHAAATDVGFVGAMMERYGIDVKLEEEHHDVVLPGQWLQFDAMHKTTESLVHGLRQALLEARPDVAADKIIPLFYIGGFEEGIGFYPDAAFRPGGIFVPLTKHKQATLAHELGTYFGLPHSSGRTNPDDPTSPIVNSNAPDVIEGDPLNVMSNSKLPAGRQKFTYGQMQRMLLRMLDVIG